MIEKINLQNVNKLFIIYLSYLIFLRLKLIYDSKSIEYRNILLCSLESQLYNISLLFLIFAVILMNILSKDGKQYNYYKIVIAVLLFIIRFYDLGNSESYISKLSIKRIYGQQYVNNDYFKFLLDYALLTDSTSKNRWQFESCRISTKSSDGKNFMERKDNQCCNTAFAKVDFKNLQEAYQSNKYFISEYSKWFYSTYENKTNDEKQQMIEEMHAKFQNDYNLCIN